MTTVSQTPLMQQYREIKGRHQNAILFFRMGEFYEMFYEDAETASRVLGLTLTSRNNGGASEVPLAGVPVKAAGDYVRRLVQRGFRVAICEQVEDPKTAKGVVRREVIETVTPGVAFADDLLDGGRNNFICALTRERQRDAGGGMTVSASPRPTSRPAKCGSLSRPWTNWIRCSPGSRLASSWFRPRSRFPLPASRAEALVTEREVWEFDEPLAREDLARQYGVLSLEGLGIDGSDGLAVSRGWSAAPLLARAATDGIAAAGAAEHRAAGRHDAARRDDAPQSRAGRIAARRRRRRHVALCARSHGTPMGARLLRQWILAPLTSCAAIDARLDAVGTLSTDVVAREAMREAIDDVRDIERLAAKAAAGRSTPRELRALGDSLAALPAVAAALSALLKDARATERDPRAVGRRCGVGVVDLRDAGRTAAACDRRRGDGCSRRRRRPR